MRDTLDRNFEPGSFRDRNGRIFYYGGNVYRGLSDKALKEFLNLSSKGFFSRGVTEGKIIPTEPVDPSAKGIPFELVDGWAAVLKHRSIPFVSYPYEWSFGMLKDAALLHLDLLKEALREDMILKDSSPFNIQWVGARPVFIDIPSFERLAPGDPWVGYFQFCQLFLYPLFLQAYKDVEFHPWLRGRIDGIDPEQMDHLMSLRDKVRPGVLTHVYFLAKMQRKFGNTRLKVRDELRTSGFRKEFIEANVERLRKLVSNLEWKRLRSMWSHYADSHSYIDADLSRKAQFVEEVMARRQWRLVWDIGCNTGTFSRLAARQADYVIAIDADHLAVESLYHVLKKEGNNNILPLVLNIVDASPNLGWQGKERKEMALRGTPDLVLCLALIHHIVIGANVPLSEFVRWLASLRAAIVIEFVTKNDPMVRKLLLNKEDQYPDYDVGCFENYLCESFELRQKEVLEAGTRMMYFADPKAIK